MCVYCFCGDWAWKYDPPYWPKPNPLVPEPVWPKEPDKPVTPPPDWQPWKMDRLKEYLELLKQIKALEDQIGCPCEPNKADHIKILEERIAELEKNQPSPTVNGTSTVTQTVTTIPPDLYTSVTDYSITSITACGCGKSDCKCGNNCSCQPTRS